MSLISSLVLLLTLAVCGSHATHSRQLQAMPSLSLAGNGVLGTVTSQDGCRVTVDGLRFNGDVAVKYLADVASDLSYDGLVSAPRLTYSAIHQDATDSWTIEATLQNCDAPSQIILWCESCNVDGRPVADIALAATGEQDATSAVVIILSNADVHLSNNELNSKTRRSLLAANTCTPVVVNGKTYTYDYCINLQTALKLSVPFEFQYSLSSTDSGTTTIKGAITADPAGWASIGFPAGTSSGMIGANAVFVAPDSASPTGASVYGVLMKTTSAAGINAAKGTFALTDTAAVKNADGSLVGVFTAQLADNYNTLTTTPRRMIYGIGMMVGDALGTHITSNKATYPYGKATLQLQGALTPAAPDTTTPSTTPSVTPSTPSVTPKEIPAAKNTTAADETTSSDSSAIISVDGGPNEALLWAHVWLVTIGFGVLTPLGAMIAHAWKDHDPYWFKFHRGIQSLGVLTGLAGIICIFVYCGQKYDYFWDTDEVTHRNIGVAVLALMLFQMLSIIYRPKVDTPLRKYWWSFHVLAGVSSMIMAIYNIYEGLINIEETESWTYIVYSVVLGGIVAVGVGKDVHDIKVGKRTKYMVRSKRDLLEGIVLDPELGASGKPGQSSAPPSRKYIQMNADGVTPGNTL